MTNKLQDLRETIINTLNERGLKQCHKSPALNDTRTSFNLTGNQLITYGEERLDFKNKPYKPIYVNGLELGIRETYHSNGAAENTSYYIEITKWVNNCGFNLGRIKISSRDSLKKQVRLINEMVDKYLELAKEVK